MSKVAFNKRTWANSYVEKALTNGLYVARYLDMRWARSLYDWAAQVGIPNLVPPEMMHITILYSEKVPENFEADKDPIVVYPANEKLARFGRQGEALVYTFDDDQLTSRHDRLINAGGMHGFPEYHPHITLSYDATGFDSDGLFPPGFFGIALQGETYEALNEEWATQNNLKGDQVDKSFLRASPITKVDDDQHLVYGWASVIEEGGQLVVDFQQEIITEPELVKAAHKFVTDARVAKAMHQGRQVGEVVESLVFTKDLQKALGVDLGKVGWFICMKISDPGVWKKVKSGEFKAFSIGGAAFKTEVKANG